MRTIIEMARDAGIDAETDTLCRYEGWVEPLERFIKLVRADERDAILKLADSLGWVSIDDIIARANK